MAGFRCFWACWASFVSVWPWVGLLGEFCLGLAVGGLLLGEFCLGLAVGGLLLGEFCLGLAVGGLLPGELFRAATTPDAPAISR